MNGMDGADGKSGTGSDDRTGGKNGAGGWRMIDLTAGDWPLIRATAKLLVRALGSQYHDWSSVDVTQRYVRRSIRGRGSAR